jgi:WD40 repeat protein/serine/threonine protein kinase
MHDPDSCHPTAEQLRAFFRGDVDATEEERVAAHVAGCAACCAALVELTSRDGLLTRLQDAVGQDPADREADAARQSAVRALRRRHSRGTLTPRPSERTAPEPRATPREDLPPTPPAWHVGSYDILGEVGRGGMGVVYKARHRELNRVVALKMVLAGEFASASERLRFRREAELAARVRHDRIVQIYEVGQAGDRPYLAMEWVEGGTLADRLDGTPWPAHPSAHLVCTLARAIDAAHRQGVIHRDLKPANILVQPDEEASSGGVRSGPHGAGPLVGLAPKITDFGLARAVQGQAGLTRTGFTVGTPEYMAPEQAGGDSASVGPPVDVYALGVILYQLLTGRPPFRGESPAEVLRASASVPPIAPRRLEPRVPRDLETITLKAIEKEPARRYRTAEALAEDLRRFNADEPILARPPSALYHLRQFTRRHTGLVGGVFGVFTALLAGTIVSVGFAWRAEHNARQAIAEKREARFQAYRARLAAAVAALSAHDVADAHRQLEGAPVELRGWEWRHLQSRLDDSSSVIFLPAGMNGSLIPGPDQLRVGILTGDALRLTNLEGGELATLPLFARGPRAASATQTGRGLRVAAWVDPRTFHLLDEAGRRVCRVDLPGDNSGPRDVIVSQDGTRLALRGSNLPGWTGIFVFDAASGRLTASCKGHLDVLWSFALSPDGTRVATTGEDRTAHVWDAGTGAEVVTCRGHTSKVLGVAFRPDGARLLTTSADGTVRQWDAATGREVEPPYDRHTGEVSAAVYSPDGQSVASAGTDRTIRVWRATSRRDIAVLHGHTGTVTGLAFAPNGRRLASLCTERGLGFAGDNTVRVWDVGPRDSLPVLRGHTSYVYPVAFSPDGRWIASGGWDHTVRLWDAATGEHCATLHYPGIVRCLAFGPDGGWLVTGGDGGSPLRIWDVATARVRQEIPVPGKLVDALAVSPDGTRVAATAIDGQSNTHQLHIYDIASGDRLFSAQGGGLAYSPDGRWLAVQAADMKTVLLLDAATHRTSARFSGHENDVVSATFNAGSQLLASCGLDRTVRLWQVDSGACVVLRAHTDDIFAIAFHPDGTRLATAGRDRAIWLWDLARGEEVARLQGHTSYVWSLGFSPDGATLASGSGDFTVRLWDTAPLKTRHQARREAEALRTEAERLVDSLSRQKDGPAEVVAAIRAEQVLREPLRHAALRTVLQRTQTIEPTRGNPEGPP